MVNNIPVNGWPQLKDLEAVQPILNRLDKIEAWKRTVKEETFMGEEITIPNALALPARSLKTTINAIQDLHGYDKPWAGGAGKNKLQNTLTTTTIYGVTFTVNSDGTVTANGKATGGHAQFQIPITGLSGDFGFDGCPSGGAEGKYDVYVWDMTTNARVQKWDGTTRSDSDFDSASLKQIKLPSEHNFLIVLRVFEGFTANNFVFKPMICASTETDATFAPYSNICPISGRDSVVLTRSDGDEISEDFTIQLGTTVYGADINWDTGVATVTDVIVDLGSLTYGKDTTTRPADGATINAFYATLSDAKKYGNTEVADIKCSQYVAASVRDVDYGGYDSIKDAIIGGVDSNSRIWVYDSQYASYTVAAFKVAMSGVQLCYKLATPTTIQLTPEQLEMLKGVNRVTLSDGYGTIELKALTGANWS